MIVLGSFANLARIYNSGNHRVQLAGLITMVELFIFFFSHR